MMRMVILSQSAGLYSTARLIEAGRGRGHAVLSVNPLRCTLGLRADRGAVLCSAVRLVDVDVVIPRIDPAITAEGTAVLAQFEAMDVWPLNEAAAIERSRDKFRASQLLASVGIPVPKTRLAVSNGCINDWVAHAGSTPLVVKPVTGCKGRGVVIARTVETARSAVQSYLDSGTRFLVQEFIEGSGGSDIRCLVVGDRVVASIKRTARRGEYRTNLYQGGTASAVKLSSEERRLAIHAARTLGLEVAGVDLIRAPRGTLVIEVNSSPGLQGIERATRLDLADLMIEYVEDRAIGTRSRK